MDMYVQYGSKRTKNVVTVTHNFVMQDFVNVSEYCSPLYWADTLYEFRGVCVENCPSGYFLPEDSMTCEPCGTVCPQSE